MPIITRKHHRGNFVKFFRPQGTKFAHGEFRRTPEEAVEEARIAFVREFKMLPLVEHTQFEVVGVTGGYKATMLEIIDNGS